MREKYGADPTVDDDGDFVLHHLGQPVWVRVRTDQAAVEIMARVAHDVHSRRATAVEIGLLNRDNLCSDGLSVSAPCGRRSCFPPVRSPRAISTRCSTSTSSR